jgi:aspartate/methionine/tyrosine aminotransferase
MMKVDELGCRTDEQFVLEMLQRTAVLVVHGSGFGSNPHDGYFRLVYLADQETLTQSLTEIGRFVSSR